MKDCAMPYRKFLELDGIKVPFVGTVGTIATIELSQIAAIVSIGVGLVTGAYVSCKLFFLIRNHGRPVE